MKIFIIGCSGSGKTHFAKTLCKMYKIPHFDLDNIYWDNNSNCYGIKTPLKKREELLNDILKNNDWIIEGIYYSWTQNCFKEADKIFVLDIPKRVCIYRIIKRFIQRKLGLEKGKKETITSNCQLIKWTNKYISENMPQIRKIVSQYQEKTTYIKKPLEIKHFIDHIQQIN